MERTRVIFAFGGHGDEKTLPSRKFFKAAITPILEDLAAKRLPGTIIHEATLLPRLSVDKQERLVRGKMDSHETAKLEELLEWKEAALIEKLGATLDVGKPIRWKLLGKFLGFERRLLFINKSQPGLIRNTIEPQAPEALRLSLQEELLAENISINSSEGMDLIREKIHVMSTLIELRDRHLLAQIRLLREEDPLRTIIVPRGFLHVVAGADETLLDRGEFDVSFYLEMELSGIPLPDALVALASSDIHHGKLTDERMDAYATLALGYTVLAGGVKRERGIDIKKDPSWAEVALETLIERFPGLESVRDDLHHIFAMSLMAAGPGDVKA